MMQIDNQLQLRRGLQLGYASYGQADGIPAFYFHGLPGSRREGILLHRACLDAGIRLIAPDRPGYGLSEPVANDRLAQWPEIIHELADQLRFERFYLLAASGGAPYALACASVLSERVMGTAICCGLAMLSLPELRATMSGFARFGFWLARLSPTLLRYSYGFVANLAARLLPRLTIGLLARLQGPPDQTVLGQSEIQRHLAENLHEAFRQGATGGVADMCAAVRPWPFDPAPIRCLQLWHGDLDRVVPLAHSHWLATRVPRAKLYPVKGEAHFSLPIRYAGTVVQSLLKQQTWN